MEFEDQERLDLKRDIDDCRNIVSAVQGQLNPAIETILDYEKYIQDFNSLNPGVFNDQYFKVLVDSIMDFKSKFDELGIVKGNFERKCKEAQDYEDFDNVLGEMHEYRYQVENLRNQLAEFCKEDFQKLIEANFLPESFKKNIRSFKIELNGRIQRITTVRISLEVL